MNLPSLIAVAPCLFGLAIGAYQPPQPTPASRFDAPRVCMVEWRFGVDHDGGETCEMRFYFGDEGEPRKVSHSCSYSGTMPGSFEYVNYFEHPEAFASYLGMTPNELDEWAGE